jgi:hypothetical protein
MNTRRVNAAADVIARAMENGRRVPAGMALALESAQMLMSPEIAAELESYRALELGAVDGRVSASCGQPNHPTWLRTKDDNRVCPWCLAEMQSESLTAMTRELETYERLEREREANQRVDGSLAAIANLRIAELSRERDALLARVAELEPQPDGAR